MEKFFNEKVILSSPEIESALQRLSCQILEKNPCPDKIALVGIQTRGVPLAQRIQKKIKEASNKEVSLALLDITLYRDDLTAIGLNPTVKKTVINFDINQKIIILVDDVLFTGRTIRAALDQIMDFGRPEKIQLLVLVDRGHRELPLRADYVGKNIPTSKEEIVEVKLREVDSEDKVILCKKNG